MQAAPYNDGDTRTFGGTTYVRQGGQWLPQAAPAGPRTISLTPGDPRRPAQIRQSAAEADTAEAHAVIERAQADAIRQRQAVEAAAARLDPSRTGAAALQGVDPTIAAHVRALTEGRIPWPNGRQIVDPHWATVVALAPLYEPGFSAEVYQGRQRAVNSYASGPGSKTITALATVLGHIEHSIQGIPALQNYSAGSLGPLTLPANALHNAWQHYNQTDAPQQTFGQVAQAVGSELETAWRPSGGTAGEIAQWQGRLGAVNSPETLRSVLQDGVRLLARRLNEVTQNYQTETNRPGELPHISDDALRILRQYARPEDAPLVFQHLQGAGAASTGGNNGGPPPTVGALPPSGHGPGGPPPAGGAPGGTPPIPGAGPDAGNPELSHDGQQILPDETQRALNAGLSQVLRSGATEAEARQWYQDHGGDPSHLTNVGNWVSFLHSNPNYNGPIVELPRHAVPLTGVQSFMNSATNALPSEVPAYLLGSGDVLSGGNLDSLSSNPELTRVGMAQMDRENPGSTLLGNVTGFGMLGAGGEAGLARLGMEGGTGIMAARPLLADAASGAYYGAGSNDDNRVAGAVLGGLSGAGGGIAGRTAGRVVGGVIRGIGDPAAQYLNDRGIPMSLSQMVGRSGPVGRAIGWMGNAMPNIPFSGTGRTAAERFVNATINQGLEPIAEDVGKLTGTQGANAMHEAVSAGYRKALDGTSVTTDQPFFSDLSAAAQNLNAIPRAGPEAWDSVRSVIRPQPGAPSYIDAATGNLSGTNMQPLLQDLQNIGLAYRRANDPLASRIQGAIGGVRDAVGGMFDRQAPEVMPGLRAANEAFRNSDIIDDAMSSALNKDRLFSPAQLGSSLRQNGRYIGGPRAIAEGDTPFNDLQRFGQQVLPNTVPDSGTAGRLALLGALGALGGAGGGAAGYSNGEDVLPSGGEGLGEGLTLAAMLMGGHALGRPLLQKALLGGSRDVRAMLGNRAASVPTLWDALGLGAAGRYIAPTPDQVLQP